ncbi:trypsin-1-like [Aethina tumida]|uniref:trypsin-1-like n=1 Tax=Aethina tumida TaxID=116153 RepID=UPI0021473B48|nr:trypsin-1-like [Aethina tumida]
MLKLVIALACVAAIVLAAPKIKQTKRPFPSPRIVGGKDANITDYPYQVSLLWGKYHTCGGSIISEKWVVTAAHCTDGTEANQLKVRVGSSIVDEGGVVIDVAAIHQNPAYDDTRINNDISILELASEITFGDNAQPIALVDAHVVVAAGTEAVVTGWGLLDEDDWGLSPQLQVVSVPIVSNADCNVAYDGDITDQMICAGVQEGGKDACQGDSGGPLVADGKLVGIVSWGYGCAHPNYPGVYSNVSALRDYVTEITGL